MENTRELGVVALTSGLCCPLDLVLLLAREVQWHLILTLTPSLSHTQEGRELTLEKPELKALVWEKLEDLHRRWDELETTTQAKARSLFDANRAELFAQSCSALESWLESLQAQLHSDDYGKDLTSVNILLKKQQVRRGPLVGLVSGK